MTFKQALNKFVDKVRGFFGKIQQAQQNYQENKFERQQTAIEQERNKREYLKEKLATTKLENQLAREKSKARSSQENSFGFGNLGQSQSEEFIIPGVTDNKNLKGGSL